MLCMKLVVVENSCYSFHLDTKGIFFIIGPTSDRSYKIGVVGNNCLVGWLVGWLVGNAVFSETTLRIFLIFCMKIGDYKGRQVTEPDF